MSIRNGSSLLLLAPLELVNSGLQAGLDEAMDRVSATHLTVDTAGFEAIRSMSYDGGLKEIGDAEAYGFPQKKNVRDREMACGMRRGSGLYEDFSPD